MAAIRIERRGDIAEVVLARPEMHNAISVDTLMELIAAGQQLRKDRNVRAVIIHAEGPSFCSGMNLPSFLGKPSMMLRHFLRPVWRSTNNFQEVAYVWRRVPVPVIVAMHGRCYGAGMQIAAAADFRIATPNCELSIMEAKWGLIPDMSGMATFRELAPIDVLKRLSMTAELFTAEQGKAWGLITEVSDEPLLAARALAEKLASRSPDCVAATKFLYQRTWTARACVAFFWERWYQVKLLMGKNQRIAVKSVQQKQALPFLPRQLQR